MSLHKCRKSVFRIVSSRQAVVRLELGFVHRTCENWPSSEVLVTDSIVYNES